MPLVGINYILWAAYPVWRKLVAGESALHNLPADARSRVGSLASGTIGRRRCSPRRSGPRSGSSGPCSQLLPLLTRSAAGRTALLGQFSGKAWKPPAELVLTEPRGFDHSPSLDEALTSLVKGPAQQGASAGTLHGALTTGTSPCHWSRAVYNRR